MPGFLGEELTKRQQEALKKSREQLKKEQEKLKKATTSTSSTKGNSGAKTGTTKNATQVRSSIESNKSVSKKQVQNYVAKSAQRVATKTVPPVTRNAIQVRSSIENNKPVSREAINNTVKKANETFSQKAGDKPWYSNYLLNGLYSASVNTQKALLRPVLNVYNWMNENSNQSGIPALSNAQSKAEKNGTGQVDPWGDFLNRYYESLTRDQETLNEAAQESIGESKGKQFAYDAAGAFGKVVMEIPLLVGGAGETKAGIEAVSATGKLLNALKELPKNPVTWFRATETYGRTYDQSIADGATPEEANQRAVMLAFIMPATETLGGADAALRSLGGTKGFMALLGSVSKAAGSEALEEPGQGMIEAASRNVYTDVPLASMEDQNAIINPNRMMYESALGATVGALAGGATTGISNVVNRVGNIEPMEQAEQQPIAQREPIQVEPVQKSVMPQQGENIANVLTSIEKERNPIGDRLKHTYYDFKQKMVDSGEAVSRLSKQTGNKNLYAAFNNARQSSASADSMILEKQRTKQGQEIGEGLNSIFEPIFKRGDGYVSDFYSYLYHVHNIDRMAQGKPVFGETVSADMSRQEAAALLQKHPEFAEYAEKVYQYERGLMEWRVDSGIYSKEEAGLFQTLYPNYVPTHRKIDSGEMFRQAGVRDIQKAKGSDIDLMPIYEQMIMQTRAVVRNARMNDFKQSLLDSAGNDMVQVASEPQAKSDIADDIENEIADTPDNDVAVWVDGKRILLAVDDDIQFALDNIRSNFKDNAISVAAREANNGFKKLVTSWSPMFLARNFMRDVQDGVFYSKNPVAFAKNIPIAMTDIARNTELFQQYKSMGAFQSSFFEYDPSVQIYKQHSAIKKNTLDRIERVNFMVEQVPRFAEFKSTLEKYSDGKVESLDGFTMEQIQEAMYNAADVTVNFGRAGTWGRAINSYAVPFFNASVQGTSKALRMVTQNPTSIRAWGSLALRAGLLGIPMSIINYLMHEDDEEYQAFPDRDKNLYFFIRYEGENGETEWLKIPKGRITGAIGSLAVNVARVANGESFEDAFADYGQTLKESVAPINPFTGNLWAGIDAVARTGKTWYGGDIESQSMQNLPPGQRYDEKTTSVAKWLGEKTNFSPKKIDYLFDAYGGAIEEMIAPYLTPTSRDGYFQNAFKVDPTYSNKYLSKFYDLKEEVTYDKNDKENQGDNEADVTYRYVNSISSMISDLNAQIKEIESGTGSDEEKRERVAEIKQQINALAQSVTENIDAYKTSAQKYFASTGDIDMAYVYANKEVFGVQYALENYPYRPDLWSDASAAQKAVGLDPWSFSEMLITASGFTSSKDANGDTIDGQAKKDKVIDYVSGLDISDEQKDYFFYDVMGYTRNKPVEWGGGSSSQDMTTEEFVKSLRTSSAATPTTSSETKSTEEFVKSLRTSSTPAVTSHEGKTDEEFMQELAGSSYTRPVSGNITATFGQKGSIWPSGSHHGLDFSAPVGTSCKAVQDGTVTKIMRDYNGSIYGNRIEITHADGTVTSYSHLSNIGVEKGDTVSSGQVIGKTGNTGNVSGAHLHFEVIVNGKLVDPQDYYDFN